MRIFITSIAFLCITLPFFAQDAEESVDIEFDELELQKFIDSLDSRLDYKYGKVVLDDGLATIEVPNGYRFLTTEDAKYVLEELWGNPPEATLGLLLPEDSSPIADDFKYAVEVSYSKDGYIDDEDAAEIDYDELLETMQEDAIAFNKQRIELGYETVELVGWASTPYYDSAEKKLHWAKELHFEGYDENTLNYNIRILGRKGYLTMNVIGEMAVLDDVKTDIPVILNSVAFNEGHRYADFNPDIDTVAAYGIGGLIAGKVLAKAGFFALILKFWKIIAIGAVGAFSVFRKKIFGGKD